MENSRRSLRYRGNRCLNCQQELDKSEEYCHNCGQVNSTKKLDFNDFFHEFFSGIFAYDSRFNRTLSVLLFQPGRISKEYIEGKRQRYANPYKFYLSASIIFFILFSLLNDVNIGEPPASAQLDEESRATVDSILNTEQLSPLNLQFQEDAYRDIYVSEDSLDTLGFGNRSLLKTELFLKFHKQTEISDPRVALDSLKYSSTSYNRWLYEKTVDLSFIGDNPSIFVNYFLGKLPFIIFFYLPVFALFIWLLYMRRPYTYMEHLVFTFHTQTQWFVIYGIALLLNHFFDSFSIFAISTILFLIYLYKALRKFYGQGRVKTFLKFIVLNVIFFILAFIAAVLSVIASLATF